jgi:6-phosphogluconolactonase
MTALDDALHQLAHLEVQHAPADQLAQALALRIAAELKQAITERGRAVLAVSGGRSPIALFQSLSRIALDWSQVTVTLVDDRCVPCTHEASNALLVRTHLLQGEAARAQLLALVPQAQTPLPPLQALRDAADQALHDLGPADVMVLGMGSDGHTASLFPGATELAAALDERNPRTCIALSPNPLPPEAPYPRLTQTLAHILSSRQLLLPVAGADKLATLERALAQRTEALPISFVLHQTRTPLALWITP